MFAKLWVEFLAANYLDQLGFVFGVIIPLLTAIWSTRIVVTRAEALNQKALVMGMEQQRLQLQSALATSERKRLEAESNLRSTDPGFVIEQYVKIAKNDKIEAAAYLSTYLSDYSQFIADIYHQYGIFLLYEAPTSEEILEAAARIVQISSLICPDNDEINATLLEIAALGISFDLEKGGYDPFSSRWADFQGAETISTKVLRDNVDHLIALAEHKSHIGEYSVSLGLYVKLDRILNEKSIPGSGPLHLDILLNMATCLQRLRQWTGMGSAAERAIEMASPTGPFPDRHGWLLARYQRVVSENEAAGAIYHGNEAQAEKHKLYIYRSLKQIYVDRVEYDGEKSPEAGIVRFYLIQIIMGLIDTKYWSQELQQYYHRLHNVEQTMEEEIAEPQRGENQADTEARVDRWKVQRLLRGNPSKSEIVAAQVVVRLNRER